MLELPNYQFHELVAKSDTTAVYRGTRNRDKKPILAKYFINSDLSASKLHWLEYEYQIVKKLNLPCVSDLYGVENYEGHKVILMEDFGALSLSLYLKSGDLSIDTCLALAIALAGAVGDIHSRNVIHKDIKPSNILIHPETLVLKLTGFGIAAQMRRESSQTMEQGVLEGSPAYISPEQTGRMNCSVDYRSDFYSLGATFYEMLTGSPPFTDREPAELVHAHIAQIPEPPHSKRPGIPTVLSEVVLKLLEKSPENRYQSSQGLLSDLAYLQRSMADDNDIGKFTLGTSDVPEQFHPPEKLYGRVEEIKTLDRMLRDVVVGNSRMLLIEGPPGIGKTFLIQEIHKQLVARKCLFVAGKFEQFKGNTPYAPIAQAFQSAIKYLLTLSQNELDQWKKKFCSDLYPNAQVIVDIIPDLETIIGKPPDVPALGPAEALNRLNHTFQKFIRVFASAEHPLVMFIDDWQWTDAATLSLLDSIMTDTSISNLLFIGAYRNTEVGSGHPFRIQLNEIEKGGHTVIQTLTLSSLELDDVVHFVCDALHVSPQRANPLAKAIQEKTRGNPFFIKQFIQVLYDTEVIWFDRQQARWRWDTAQVQAMEVAENVVSLMLNQFKNLPPESRNELQLASCIGNQFDLKTLATISDCQLSQSFARLRVVIERGYLLPVERNYRLLWLAPDGAEPPNIVFRFGHDKIQQAAYDLVAKDKLKSIHLKIGRMLLKSNDDVERVDDIFSVVDQLNKAIDLVHDPAEKEFLAKLNLQAALKAKGSAAYASAADYLTVGAELLEEDCWQKNYTLTRELYRQRAEVEYLVGNFDRSEEIVHTLLDSLHTEFEKAQTYNLLIVQKTMAADFGEAIELGRTALKLLDINLPFEDLDGCFQEELKETYKNRKGKPIAELIHEPEMEDETKRLQIQLLTNICSAAYRSDQDLFRILVLKAVNISLISGLVVESCYTFSAYGLLLGSILGDFESGYEFGLFSLKISEKYNNPTQECRSNFVLSTTLVHWVRHAGEADLVSDRCYNVGLDSGEFQFAGYILTYKLTNLIFQGKELLALMGTTRNYLEFVIATKNRWATDMMKGTQMVLSYLLSSRADSSNFTFEDVTEKDFYKSCLEINNYSALARFHIFKGLALYVLRDYEEARISLVAAGEKVSFLFGTIYSAEYVFVDSLIHVGLLETATKKDKSTYLERIRENQIKLKLWAGHCKENFLHRYLLIKAEIANVSGEIVEAMDNYDQAIDLAKESGFVQNEAIAAERAGLFWLKRDKREIAQLYLRRAYRCFEKWGATAKLTHMRELFPELVVEPSGNRKPFKNNTVDGEEARLDDFEIDTLMRALQAISGEIILESLLEKLMSFVVMDAGADRGCLFLKKQDGYYLDAEIFAEKDSSTLFQSIQLDNSNVPHSLIRYVTRTGETVVMGHRADGPFLKQDEYFETNGPKSIMCMPIVRQREQTAVLYIENRTIANAFTPQRQKILSLLGAQVAISLENAILFREIHHEIEERRRAEEALGRSEERFRDLSDLLPQIIFEADNSGRLTYINQHGLDTLQLTKERVEKGVTASELIIAEDHDRLKKNIDDILDGMPPRGNLYTVTKQDGSTFPVVAYSSRITQKKIVSGLRGIIVDITEQSRTEKELKDTQKYLHTLFNTLPSVLIAIDLKGRIQKWNSGAEKFTKLPAAKVLGDSLWNHIPLLVQFQDKLTQVFSTFKPSELHRVRMSPQMKDYFDISFYPLASGGEKGVIIQIDDVTELVLKDQHLHQAQKMETIGSLAGGLAHDFNNLLAGITGTLSLLEANLVKEKAISPERLGGYVRTMKTANDRATSLVKQLQTLSRRQPLSLSVFKLSQAVENVVEICRNIIDKSIQVDLRLNVKDDFVEADQGQIEQMLLNICINGVHAMTIMRGEGEKQGGVLGLTLEEFHVNGITAMSSNDGQGPYLLLRVRDNGVGMDSQVVERIFDPFFTSKDPDVGTGLGLAMAYNIIKQHKGMINVYSEPDMGSTFNIFLPQADRVTLLPAESVSNFEFGSYAGHILVIDDEDIIRETAKGLLEALGFDVLVATGGDEGIALYKEHGDKIRAVLLDMAMPKKSGKDVFLELQQIDKEIKVVLSSGYRQDRRVEDTMRLGVDAFIQKPYSLVQIKEVFDHLFED